jgi:hypothetical protein
MLLLDRIAALAQVARPAKPYAKARAFWNTNRPLAHSVMGGPMPRGTRATANRAAQNFV